MTPISVDENKIPLFHGANGKLTANLQVTSPFDPLPVSANAIADASFSAKGTFGDDVPLGVSASTSLKLAPLFQEEVGCAPELAKEFNLTAGLTPANLAMVLDVGGKGSVSASGSFKYSVLSANASLEAGADARLVNARIYDDRKEQALDLIQDFLAHLKTPGAVVKPPRPGEVVYLEFGGYLSFGASLAAGFQTKGTHSFQSVANLKLSEAYKLSVTGTLSVSAKIAGRFSVQVESAEDLHPNDPGWARVCVKRQRSKDLQIAADLSASARIDTRGLPPTGKEFLGCLLGLRTKNWINQADMLIGQLGDIRTPADLARKLDGLAQDYLSTFVDKAFAEFLPSDVETLLGKLKTVVDSYTNLGDEAVSLFDRYFDRIETELKPALQEIENLGSLDRLQGEINPTLWNVLQQLTGGNILDVILDKAFGLANVQAAARKVLGLIQDDAHKEIRNFIALAKKEFDLDKLVADVGQFDTVDKLKKQASTAAGHVVERIVGKAVKDIDKEDFANVVKFIQTVSKPESEFFQKFDRALQEVASQKFTADIGLAYERSDEKTALIDVDIRLQNADGSDNPAGLAFMKAAGLGDFSGILARYDPAVVQLRAGTLTHKLGTSTGVKVNVAGWHQSFKYQSLYAVAVNTEQQIKATSGGMLHVFTTVDLSAGQDKTRRLNKHQEEMHSAFTLRFVSESTSASVDADDREYLLEVIQATAATYSSKLVDNDTTPAKLGRMLSFAAELGLNSKGATAAALQPVLHLNNGTYGAVEADYDVRFSQLGLRSLFRSGADTDVAAVREILRKIVLSNYLGQPSLEPIAWLFCSDQVRELALGNPNFVDSETVLRGTTVTIQNPFPDLEPQTSINQTGRRLLVALFLIEEKLVQVLQQLSHTVQSGNVDLKKLEKTSEAFGSALNSFDSQVDASMGTTNPIFAVLDRLIQLSTPAVQARSSALCLTVNKKKLLFQLAAEEAPDVATAAGAQ